jgi:Mg2+ and Co2+ transporter CorA
LDETDTGIPALVKATHALLESIVSRYARINDQLETAIMQIEIDQAALNDRVFLDRTFRLRGEITRVRSSLKHLSQVLRRMAHQQVAIKGFEVVPRPAFAVLADDADNVYESIDDLMVSLGALVDLRLNVSSFQMNKVMRVLAVLTALTLIPAVTGGLLGMNLSDNPWPATLQQVSFGVAVGMALCLYIFAVKGWLR